MNLDALYELRDRLNSSVVAGAGLIGEDFRLRRAIEGMEPLAKASPLFQKITAMARPLAEGKNEDAPERLLDVLALVDAVLCTQGTVSVSQEIFPVGLPKRDGAYQPQTYRMLAPLLTALTSTGGGRYNIINDAMKNTPNLFRDYRVSAAMIGALGDSYAEIADEVEKFLCNQGRNLAPLLKHDFDPLGKKDMVRRVHVIANVFGAEENEWYLSMLEQKCSPAVRSALLEALRFDKGNTQRLLDAVVQEKGNAKKSALSALAMLDTEEADRYFLERLQKKPESVEEFLVYSKSNSISDCVADHLSELLDSLLDKKEMSEKEMQDWNIWIRLAKYKTSGKMVKFYEKANDAAPILETVSGIRGGKKVPIEIHLIAGYTSHTSLCEALGTVMMNSAVAADCEEFRHMALSMWQKKHSSVSSGAALLSGLLCFTPEKAYEVLGKPAEETAGLSRLEWNMEGWSVFWSAIQQLQRRENIIYIYHGVDPYGIPQYQKIAHDLDPRWFTLMVQPKIARTKESFVGLSCFEQLACQLADTNNREVCHILAQRVHEHANRHMQFSFFDLLTRLGEPNYRGLIANYVKQNNYYSRGALLAHLKSSSMTLQEMIGELYDVAKVCRNKKRNTYVRGITSEMAEEIAKKLDSGMSLEQIMEEESTT